MAKLPDLKHFNFEELSEIISNANALRDTMRKEAVDKLAAEFAEKAATMGVDMEEILKAGRKAKRKPKGSVAAKYVNPDNANETWSGRGKMPNWIKERVEAGADKEQFAVGN